MRPARFLHLTSIIEACTWALLILAMLVRAFGDATIGASLISWAGSAHGTAFVTYLVAFIAAALWARWPAWAYAAGIAASVLPFATVALDRIARTRLGFEPRGTVRARLLADWVAVHPITLSCTTIALFVFVLGSSLAH